MLLCIPDIIVIVSVHIPVWFPQIGISNMSVKGYCEGRTSVVIKMRVGFNIERKQFTDILIEHMNLVYKIVYFLF